MPIPIGTHGQAVTPLRPTGFVEISGQRLEAKLAPSHTMSVEIGTEVVIVGNDPFGLLVRATRDVQNVTALAGFGEAVPTPAEQHDLREEQERQAWEAEQDDIRRNLHRETIVLLVPMILAFAAGYYFFDVPTAIALTFIWLGLFFGVVLAISWFGSDGSS